jgi:hypothetical protein
MTVYEVSEWVLDRAAVHLPVAALSGVKALPYRCSSALTARLRLTAFLVIAANPSKACAQQHASASGARPLHTAARSRATDTRRLCTLARAQPGRAPSPNGVGWRAPTCVFVNREPGRVPPALRLTGGRGVHARRDSAATSIPGITCQTRNGRGSISLALDRASERPHRLACCAPGQRAYRSKAGRRVRSGRRHCWLL